MVSTYSGGATSFIFTGQSSVLAASAARIDSCARAPANFAAQPCYKQLTASAARSAVKGMRLALEHGLCADARTSADSLVRRRQPNGREAHGFLTRHVTGGPLRENQGRAPERGRCTTHRHSTALTLAHIESSPRPWSPCGPPGRPAGAAAGLPAAQEAGRYTVTPHTVPLSSVQRVPLTLILPLP